MIMHRRAILAAPALLPLAARAQTWRPDRHLRLIVGFAPGGAADIVARSVAPDMSAALGQPVIVENRAGASGALATQAVTAAPPDGHTVGFAGMQLVVNPAVVARLGYDPRTDLRMVGQLTELPMILVASHRSGFGTVMDMLQGARQRELTVASAGVATSASIGAQRLLRHNQGRFLMVQYRGGALAFQAVVAGECDIMVDTIAGYHAPAYEERQAKFLAVLQDERLPTFPTMPALSETGLPADLQFRTWQGLFVRAATPDQVVAALHAAASRALSNAEVVRRFQAMGMLAKASAAPAEFEALYRRELPRWTALAAEAGLTPE
jgi:tripartite-type tricarboxylate transporter receptor subunit TctC